MDTAPQALRSRIRRWCWGLGVLGVALRAGASAVESSDLQARAAAHWAFQPLREVRLPSPAATPRMRAPVDLLLGASSRPPHALRAARADREVLLRRVAMLVTGLPPTPEEQVQFRGDRDAGAVERMIERYLASPRYAERWGKLWLDAAGYADSNGYFNADTDRPLAHRYRDYVLRAFRDNKPFDQFVREQLAGDELAGWRPGQPVTPRVIELLEATHFLRNGPDGSGESDGNPDEVRADRYYALESSMQIVGSSLLGMTVQCAKCHDHKFEPFTQRDYYQFQAFLYPAFPIERWQKPNERVVLAALPDETRKWKEAEADLDRRETALRAGFAEWLRLRRPVGDVLFQEDFEDAPGLAERWSATAPGDDAPAGMPPVAVGRSEAPGAVVTDGRLHILEGGGSGDRWLATRRAFPWRPTQVGGWIEVSFDLVSRTTAANATPAERVGYFIAAHDFDDSSARGGGNILVDGHPAGRSSVHVDYPGPDEMSRGAIGGTGYQAGRRYGVRVTREGQDAYSLQHLVDGVEDGAALTLTAADLPDGAFAFEYCCGRGFVVDDLRIEQSPESGGVADPAWRAREAAYAKELAQRRKELEDALKGVAAARTPEPGRIAWVADRGAEVPTVPLLKRGSPKTPGSAVEPRFPEFLGGGSPTRMDGNADGVASADRPFTGRRRAWAEWLTTPGSRQAALLARVTVNRLWQGYFGTGLVATPENLGLSGAKPEAPDLLEWLAGEFVRSGWDQKIIHRRILESAMFQQESETARTARDGVARGFRFPVQRLDAEAWRDSVLAVSGRLDLTKVSGPYVPTRRNDDGEVVVDEAFPGAFARSVFLQQRRTQVPTVLGVFDAPSIVVNCTRRATTTMPLQSLALLNSEFVVNRARDLAARLERETPEDGRVRVVDGYRRVYARAPDRREVREALEFLEHQTVVHAGADAAAAAAAAARRAAWVDLCHVWLASNEFLYVE